METIPETMHAWAVADPVPGGGVRVERVERVVPAPGPRQLLVQVEACGVCRTDLHLAEGDLPPHRERCVPGHEVVGHIVAEGSQVAGYARGDRVGVAWLGGTCGECGYCRRGAENLCPHSTYTGWDVDGGYAPYLTVNAAYAYRLPSSPPAAELAPLLCAGIIGYRALKRAELPRGGRLGIYGFGASAHLTAQIAMAQGATVHVLTRSAEARKLALDLGCASAAGSHDAPPEPLDSAILFAPAGDLVPTALEALAPGGTLAIAGIHLSAIPRLDYAKHLFQERSVRSVTANTRQDGRELFDLLERVRIRVRTQPYPMAHADLALTDLAADRVNGAAVLVP
ncbi:zinc-dependent alcohol dehydrogenase family protein [Actinospica sp. MGRD01-02]|uniref:Probable alcohol dehydrogenase AdhA n=2 Tax=Actinospica acidithermotolerans TaxID=2828514 RepID=A0A941IH21_9ACTN|nr:zinc-dependent alcohol dehydrogenase family protein [Actinospica acidithermotolerans]MBR7828045.1 zinc-dependent alcohol dehydrogenase family protein [Actinospica acidithermotolerans]